MQIVITKERYRLQKLRVDLYFSAIYLLNSWTELTNMSHLFPSDHFPEDSAAVSGLPKNTLLPVSVVHLLLPLRPFVL